MATRKKMSEKQEWMTEWRNEQKGEWNNEKKERKECSN